MATSGGISMPASRRLRSGLPLAGRSNDHLLVARVDEQDAAGAQVAVERGRGARREVGLARGDRPVDQRIEARLVASRDRGRPDRPARPRCGCAGPRSGPRGPALLSVVDLLVAGDDVGEPDVERALERLLLGERRRAGLLRRRRGDGLRLGLRSRRRRPRLLPRLRAERRSTARPSSSARISDAGAARPMRTARGISPRSHSEISRSISSRISGGEQAPARRGPSRRLRTADRSRRRPAAPAAWACRHGRRC